MTTGIETTGNVPEFDLADRMRKSLRHADLGVQGMADYLDVTRGTVGNWINGRIHPSTQTLRLWALRTGVPFKWLETGETPTGNNPDGGETPTDNGLKVRSSTQLSYRGDAHLSNVHPIDFTQAA